MLFLAIISVLFLISIGDLVMQEGYDCYKDSKFWLAAISFCTLMILVVIR